MKTSPPSRAADQFVVRLPVGMRDRIAEEAKANNRSMNAEIVFRLAQSLEPANVGNTPDAQATAIAEKLAAPVNRQTLESLVETLLKLGGR
ncbi:DNA-binding protein [Massilia violaceinigra]|uniref:DNA-binding protein n=1 Tax=Massilia violaceinigra TaxID=2045208 RepID=A0A2D2DJA9_9BURK|nr:Arc family DNA-binding protein [Massilia violaceinigra]ATQ75060.1 DNA-binding protein [Massilia violaceinigra]